MRKTEIAILCSIALAACGGDDDSDAGGNSPALLPTAIGAACGTQGVLGCDGDILAECDDDGSGNLVWFGIRDCLQGYDMICVEQADGDAACEEDPDRPLPPPPVCELVGHTPGAQMAFYDNDLFGHYRIDSYELDATGQGVNNMLILFTMPGLPLNVEHSFVGQNSKLETCSTCLVGFDAQNRMYMADEGSVNFAKLDDVQVIATLSTDVKLREVTVSDANMTSDVVDGVKWCIENLSIMAQVMRFPCEFMGITAGQSACLTADQIAVCEPPAAPNGLAALHPGETCAGTCSDSDPVGTASCQ